MKRTISNIGAAGLLLLVGLIGCSNGDGENVNLQGGVVDRESHLTRFPIELGTQHGEIECNDCHGAFDTFKEFTCIDCHAHAKADTDLLHTLVNGYQYESTFCYDCHAQGKPFLEDHQSLFPIDPGTKHEGLDCETCHPSPRDRSVLGCATPACHAQGDTDPKHANVTGYQYESRTCYGCHPTGAPGEFVQHGAIFPIAQGEVHDSLVCSDCHQNVTDRSQVSCTTCHEHSQTVMGNAHLMIWSDATYGYAFNVSNCLKCHPNSDVYPVSGHIPFNITGGPHAALKRGCLDCHAELLPASAKLFDAANFAVVSCFGQGCHKHGQQKMDGSHLGLVADYNANTYGNWSKCTSCHPQGKK